MVAFPFVPGDHQRYAKRMHVDRTTMLLPKYPSREDLKALLREIASPRSVEIRFFDTRCLRSGDRALIDVLTDRLYGAAECELDIHWNGNCRLGDDAVGFRLVELMKCEIVVRNYEESPTSWMLLKPGFETEDLFVDEELLSSKRCLRYNIA